MYPFVQHFQPICQKNFSNWGMTVWLQACPLKELKQTREWEKCPDWFTAPSWDPHTKKLGKAAPRTASRQSGFKVVFKKTANHRISQMYADDSVTEDLSCCWASYDHHPWRLCSLQGLNLQLDNGNWISHTCFPLDCVKRCWQPDPTTTSSLTESTSLLQKSRNWMEKPRLACDNMWHPPSGPVVEDIQDFCGDKPEPRSSIIWIDTQTKWPSQVACVSKIGSFEEFEVVAAGAKPETSHLRSIRGERCRKRKHSTIYLDSYICSPSQLWFPAKLHASVLMPSPLPLLLISLVSYRCTFLLHLFTPVLTPAS